MSEPASKLGIIEDNTETVSVFGYELIREILLHEILGTDAPEILYWAGKRLARKFPLESLAQTIEFFQEAGWGNLTLNREAKDSMEFELNSPIIKKRCKQNNNCTFRLEAGFLAQQIEMQKQVICETFEHPRKKGGKVQFTVKWDKKDKLSD